MRIGMAIMAKAIEEAARSVNKDMFMLAGDATRASDKLNIYLIFECSYSAKERRHKSSAQHTRRNNNKDESERCKTNKRIGRNGRDLNRTTSYCYDTLPVRGNICALLCFSLTLFIRFTVAVGSVLLLVCSLRCSHQALLSNRPIHVQSSANIAWHMLLFRSSSHFRGNSIAPRCFIDASFSVHLLVSSDKPTCSDRSCAFKRIELFLSSYGVLCSIETDFQLWNSCVHWRQETN